MSNCPLGVIRRVENWNGITWSPAEPPITTYELSGMITSNESRLPSYMYEVTELTVTGAHEVPPGGKSCAVREVTSVTAADAKAGKAKKRKTPARTERTPNARNRFISGWHKLVQ